MKVEWKSNDDEMMYCSGEEFRLQYPAGVVKNYVKVVDRISAADDWSAIRMFRGLRAKKMKVGEWKGFWSLRLNDQYRTIVEVIDGKSARIIKGVVDYHD